MTEYELKVFKRISDRTEPQDDCLLWQGQVQHCGYGQISFHGKIVTVHRVMWIIKFGTIPEGLCVCHRCDNKRCVEPCHLYLATPAENLRDWLRKNGGKKLSVKDVLEIRSASDTVAKQLAAKFSIHKVTVTRVRNRRMWRWI